MKINTSIRFSRLIVTITLFVLLYIAYLFYARLQSLLEYSNLVDETNNLNFKIEECFSILKDAETGQRGYLLTKDSIFLEPLNDANNKIYASLNELRNLTNDDPDYKLLIESFIKTSSLRVTYLNDLARNDKSYKDYSGINENVLLRGKLAMDDIRRLKFQIHKQIDIKLDSRQKLKNKYAILTPLLMIILALMSITLIYISYLIIVRELRARILIQNELQYHIKALERSNSELEQFAYVASHDLQEPLRKIQTFGNRLQVKHNEALNDDGKFIVDRMQNAAERMRILINDLLSYSQIANSNVKKTVSVDMNVSLRNVLDLLNESITASNAKITYEKLPVVLANGTQIEQLLMNLITNALKFVRPQIIPHIIIRYSTVEGQQIKQVKPGDSTKFFHKISIADNGIGFDELYAEKIFIIFQRLEGKSEFTGTGIGLAMCKRIIDNHDGYIIAKSKVNHGSEFMFYLPLYS
ncbi:MAG: CHASE3 domain-containing protein [Bacteroidota bacterium]